MNKAAIAVVPETTNDAEYERQLIGELPAAERWVTGVFTAVIVAGILGLIAFAPAFYAN